MKIKYVQLESDAFLTDLDFVQFSPAERGLYCSLIFLLNSNDGKCEFNPPALARMFNCTGEEFENIWKNISKKFQTREGVIRHKRVTKELRKSKKLRQNKRRAGLKGAQVTWQNHGTANGNDNGIVMAKEREGKGSKGKKREEKLREEKETKSKEKEINISNSNNQFSSSSISVRARSAEVSRRHPDRSEESQELHADSECNNPEDREKQALKSEFERFKRNFGSGPRNCDDLILTPAHLENSKSLIMKKPGPVLIGLIRKIGKFYRGPIYPGLQNDRPTRKLGERIFDSGTLSQAKET